MMRNTLVFLALLGLARADEVPTHREAAPIKIPIGGDGLMKTIAMDRRGNLLIGVSWLPEGATPAPAPGRLRGGPRDVPGQRGNLNPQLAPNEGNHAYALKVVSPDGTVLATWPMTDGLQPKMIFACDDGVVYVAGGGKLASFSETGKLLKMIDTDAVCGQRALASGVCANERYVFLALGMGNSMRATEDIYRFDRDLGAPKLIVERQFGCCSHIDLKVVGSELIVAENSRHRMNRFDFDGKPLGTWGKRDRVAIEGFAACCNPCNFDLVGGVIFTAESGVGRVKKYAPDGKFLGVVGYVDTTKFDNGSQLAAQSCYIPVEVNADASRIYVMDVRAAIVRVLERIN